MGASRDSVLTVDGQQLECRTVASPENRDVTLVLLHEGLGSAALWGGFPERLAGATGARVVAVTRAGYGWSSPAALPRPPTYLHEEAARLGAVLDAIGFERGFLLGHSDGASIAAIHLGARPDPRLLGATLIAPHFVVEDLTVASLREVREAWGTGELRRKLARWHRDPEGVFRGWNDCWLDPAFRSWDITGELGRIRVPVQVIQGEDDQYGTLRQVAIAVERCGGPVETAILPGIGHSPHREAPDATVAAVAGFVERILEGGPDTRS